MAITVDAFKTEFPEFVDAPDALVSVNLTRAQEVISESSWGDKREQGVFLTAARNLALSPYARHMSNENAGDGKTSYDARLAMLKAGVTSGFRVT